MPQDYTDPHLSSQDLSSELLSQQDLIDLAQWTMPFGKYQGKVLIDLPEEYLLWFNKGEWPSGRLGYLLKVCLEIKIDGSEGVVKAIKNKLTTG